MAYRRPVAILGYASRLAGPTFCVVRTQSAVVGARGSVAAGRLSAEQEVVVTGIALVLLLGCAVEALPGDGDGDGAVDTVGDSVGDSDADTLQDTVGDSVGDSVEDSPADTVEPEPTLTVLSLNLHCFKLDGTAFSSNDERFAAIAAKAADEGVQAIAAQEACVNDAHGVAMDRLVAALEGATGLDWGQAWTPTHIAWQGTADEAQEGVGLLTAGGLPQDVAELTYSGQGALLRKTLVGTPPGTNVRLYTVHLEYDRADARRLQARQTAMDALVRADAGSRALIAGDYNAIASDPALGDVAGAGFVRLTAGADDGSHIDHVFAPAAANFEVLDARMVLNGVDGPWVSDHPGVVLRVRPRAPAVATVTRFVARATAPSLALRGDTAPLSWELGWPGVQTANGRWETAFHGWTSGTVAYKWLTGDAGWETGDDHTAAVGAMVEVNPSF